MDLQPRADTDSLIRNLYTLQQDGLFCDTQLKTQDGPIFVHSVVLAAFHQVFNAKLSEGVSSADNAWKYFLDLSEWSGDTVQALIQIIYTGDCSENHSKCDEARIVLNKLTSVKAAIPCTSQITSDIEQSNSTKSKSDGLIKLENKEENDTDEELLSLEVGTTVPLLECSQKPKVGKSLSRKVRQAVITKTPRSKRKEVHKTIERSKFCQCGEEFTNQKLFRKHRKKCKISMSSTPRKSCLQMCGCGKQFRSSVWFDRHKALCKTNDSDDKRVIVYCKFCKKAFQDEKTMREHISEEHNAERKFKCNMCERSFSKEFQLWTHKNKTHEVPLTAAPVHLEVFTCQVEDCRYRTLNRKSFKHHSQVTHSEARPYQCDQCGNCFKTKNAMIMHSRDIHGTHKGDNEKKCESTPTLCSFCPYMVKEAVSFHQHMWTVHNIEPPSNYKRYCCEHCDYKVLSRKGAFDDHMRIHLGITPHKCTVCNRSFTSKSRLTGHMKFHAEKDLQCPSCEKKFAHPKTLEVHIAVMHTHKDVKQWHCETCGYCTNLKGNLNLHLRNVHKQTVVTKQKRIRKLKESNEVPAKKPIIKLNHNATSESTRKSVSEKSQNVPLLNNTDNMDTQAVVAVDTTGILAAGKDLDLQMVETIMAATKALDPKEGGVIVITHNQQLEQV